MGSLWVGRCLKSFLEVLRFVVSEYRAVGSHRDPIRDQNHDFLPKLLRSHCIWEVSEKHLGVISNLAGWLASWADLAG